MNVVLLLLAVAVSFLHLKFKGDLAWFTKETCWVIRSFLTAIVIFNLTRRRIFGIRVLGSFYLAFSFFQFLFMMIDKMLMSIGIYILSDLVFYTMPLYITILGFAFYVVWKRWKTKRLNLTVGK